MTLGPEVVSGYGKGLMEVKLIRDGEDFTDFSGKVSEKVIWK